MLAEKCPGTCSTIIVMTFPKKLAAGDTVRVIAPSLSLSIIGEDVRAIATKRLEALGLRVTFGEHVEEQDEWNSSSIESRIADLHAAFADPSVSAVFAVIGGSNCNQLIPHIDWDLVRSNPKVFIGFSDTTALQHAMLTKADLVTYSGPAYSTFGQKLHFDYTLDMFVKCLMRDEPFAVPAAAEWTDDEWYIDQDARTPITNEGPWVLREGTAEGTILGANLCTLQLLHGTEYMPDLAGSILFIEEDDTASYQGVDRDLESLLMQPGAQKIKGIVIGRFQKASNMTRANVERLIALRPQLAGIPVIANADFGHTSPIFTIPMGGSARISAQADGASIEIVAH